MKYPLEIPCNKYSDVFGRCEGIANLLEKPPLDCTPEKGPWYGCRHCGCVAQYDDFVMHAQLKPITG